MSRIHQRDCGWRNTNRKPPRKSKRPLVSRIPVTELPVHHRDGSRLWLTETPICLDMLSCDLIRLRNSAPLMDEPNICLCTLKASPDLVTNRSPWPCWCPSCCHLLTGPLQSNISWQFTLETPDLALYVLFVSFCLQSQRDIVLEETDMSHTVKTRTGLDMSVSSDFDFLKKDA